MDRLAFSASAYTKYYLDRTGCVMRFLLPEINPFYDCTMLGCFEIVANLIDL